MITYSDGVGTWWGLLWGYKGLMEGFWCIMTIWNRTTEGQIGEQTIHQTANLQQIASWLCGWIDMLQEVGSEKYDVRYQNY